MKKILRSLFMILIVLVAVSPYLIGMYAKRAYLAEIQVLNNMYKNNFKIVGDFSNGYISSKAKTDFIGNDGKPILSLIHTIQHGPVIFDLHSYMPRSFQLASTKTIVDAVFSKNLRTLYGNDNFYSFIVDFDFFGNSHASLKINPLTINSSNIDFKWSGLTLDGLHTAEKPVASADISIPQITYKAQAKDFDTANMKINLLLNLQTLEFSGVLTADNFNLGISGNEQVNLINSVLKFKADNYDNNGLKTYELDSSFDKFNIEKNQMGPFKFFTKMTAFNQTIVRQFILAVASGNVADIEPAKILEFLAASPAIDFNCNLTTSSGKLQITNTTKINGKDLTALDKQSIANNLQIMSDMEIDKPLAYLLLAQYIQEEIAIKEKDYTNKNPQGAKNPYALSNDELATVTKVWVTILLEKLLQTGFVSEDTTKFNVKFKLDKGLMYVNDKQKSNAELDQIAPYWDFTPAPVSTPVPPPEPTPTADIKPAQDQRKH